MSLARIAWTGLYVCCAVASFVAVQHYIDAPYMDEYFHVRQTLQYALHHEFWIWDPKITTPPGLYILGFAAAKIGGPRLSVLRSINALALPLGSWFVAADPLLVMGFPLLAFFANLYYTDVLSTLLVLGGLRVNKPTTSALLLLISLWFRQTNIVWAGVAAALRIAGNVRVGALWTQKHVLLHALTRIGPPYIALAALFASFLWWNGSIALGDKSNHEFSLHGAQVLYFLMFSTAFSAPLALPWALSRRFLRRAWLIPVEFAVIYAVIHYGTVVHPFILADNRHYTFYLWRRLVTPFHGLLLVPVYWVSWRWFLHTVDFSLLNTWVIAAATLAVLVPSPLLEARYYIVPYLVWRLCLYGKRSSSLELGWYAVINVATIAVFCVSTTHFMW